MTVVEWILAGLFGALGFRSLVYWLRRPIGATSLREHVLFAVWLTGRAGLWFAVAGIFALTASITAQEEGGLRGRAFYDEFQAYRWYVLVPIALAAMQLVAAVMLGRSRSD